MESSSGTNGVPSPSANEQRLEQPQEQNAVTDDEDNNNSTKRKEGGGGGDENGESEDDQSNSSRKLYKSPRFKGYLTLFLSSVVNYQAISVSDLDNDLNTVPASSTQAGYGATVAIISCLLTGATIVIHIDGYTCFKTLWQDKLFGKKSKVETLLDIFLVLWWGIATIIQTSVRGVAGDGKNQYNIYYSTWVCFWATCWTLESKMTEFGWPTVKEFVKSWPYRAPGWIGILVSSFFCLFWYVDLFVNTAVNPSRLSSSQQLIYGDIPKSQYQWLIFVASASLLPSAVFVFIEIFRNSDSREKSNSETYIEGISLLCLVCAWIPSVIIATTPGGFASVIGNAYVFSWTTTLFVLETSLWFVRDSRSSVHDMLEQKDEEYKEYQRKVLEKSQMVQEEAIKQGAERQQQQQQQQTSTDWTRRMFRRNTYSVGSADSANREVQENRESLPQQGGVQDVDRENDDNGAQEGHDDDHDDGDQALHHHFQMKDIDDEDNDNVDEEIRQERKMREADESAYFDNLADDVL